MRKDMIFVITKMPKDVTGRIIEIGCDCVYAACNKLYLATIVGFTDKKVCVEDKVGHWKCYTYPDKLYMIKDTQHENI